MGIEQLMAESAKSFQHGRTLGKAAHMMWDDGCGCLSNTAGGGSMRVLGMITDRGICMAAQFHGKALREIRVWDALAKDVWARNRRSRNLRQRGWNEAGASVASHPLLKSSVYMPGSCVGDLAETRVED